MNRIESFAQERSAALEPLDAGINDMLVACTPAAVAIAVWAAATAAGVYAVRTQGFDVRVDQAGSAVPGDDAATVGELLQLVRDTSN